MVNVLITGANRGIGLELSRQYADEGAEVIACCRAPDQADGLAKIAAAAGGRVRVLSLDVTSAESVGALGAALEGLPIDILINNAGIGARIGGLADLDFESWAQVMAVNTLGPLRITQAVLSNLKAAKGAKVISMSSQVGSLVWGGGNYVYGSSKAALNRAMVSLSHELKPDGIVACPVHPGWVRTDMGGPRAAISPPESAEGIRALISKLTMDDTGQFFNWNGKPHAW